MRKYYLPFFALFFCLLLACAQSEQSDSQSDSSSSNASTEQSESAQSTSVSNSESGNTSSDPLLPSSSPGSVIPPSTTTPSSSNPDPSTPPSTPPASSGSVPSDSVSYSGAFPSTTGSFVSASLGVAGETRSVRIYRPSNSANLPLLIFFLGTNNSSDLSENDFKNFADANQVVVAIPRQRNMAFDDWDNHYSGTPYWQTANANGSVASDINANPDLLFVRAIIKESVQTFSINANRVYSAGFSNGAFFSYFVGMTLNNRIAAFSETSGGLVRCASTGDYAFHTSPLGSDPDSPSIVVRNNCSGIVLDTCSGLARPIAPVTSARKVPAFLFHNDDDDSVSPAYTCRLFNELQAASYNVSLQMRAHGGGHVTTLAYLNSAWNFMKNFSL